MPGLSLFQILKFLKNFDPASVHIFERSNIDILFQLRINQNSGLPKIFAVNYIY